MAQSLAQLTIPLQDRRRDNKNHHFRPIHYLGSKLRILEFLSQILDELDPARGRVCDLFAGSGTVSSYLASFRPVTAIDIQEYSRVLCSALLNNHRLSIESEYVESAIVNSQELSILLKATQPLIKLEKEATELALSGSPELLCDVLEHGSIVSYEKGFFVSKNSDLEYAIACTLKNLHKLDIEFGCRSLITKYFGGVYFSFEQAVYLDAILSHVSIFSDKDRDFYLAALLSTVSDSVNTVGKQFAQPLQPRDRQGKPKVSLGRRVIKDRNIDILQLYSYWIEKYQNILYRNFDHEVLKSDFSDMLEKKCTEFSVVYADPPYTRDHYSRFYHTLETICLRDDPEVSTTKIGGRLRLSRGLYRLDRFQSSFCIKSKAPKAFEELFSKVAKHKKPLVLSYSPYDSTVESHPRVMTIERLLDIGKKYYNNIDVRAPGLFSHSKFNNIEKNFAKNENGEVILVFT